MKNYTCKICGKVCDSPQSIGGHMAGHRKDKGKPAASEKIQARRNYQREYRKRRLHKKETVVVNFCPSCGFCLRALCS